MSREGESLYVWASRILLSERLEDKLIPYSQNPTIHCFLDSSCTPFTHPGLPGRSMAIKFSERQLKFPKTHTLDQKENLAIALHAFANHELLAIELMALALLILPHETEEQKKWKIGILQSLQEEQEHFSLYVARMGACGYEFGAFPLSGFFWERASHFQTYEHYAAIMSLTLEAANLDFAFYYGKVFRELGDEQTSHILNQVLEDEIKHVKLGVRLLKRLKGDKSLFDYYQSLLPHPLTPARAKGIDFQWEYRRRAGMDDQFIKAIENYDDDFSITKRKQRSL